MSGHCVLLICVSLDYVCVKIIANTLYKMTFKGDNHLAKAMFRTSVSCKYGQRARLPQGLQVSIVTASQALLDP